MRFGTLRGFSREPTREHRLQSFQRSIDQGRTLATTALRTRAGDTRHCAIADVQLPAILSNGMVLQQQTSRLWGWANPNESVRVTPSWPNTKPVDGKADGRGHWEVESADATPPAGHTRSRSPAESADDSRRARRAERCGCAGPVEHGVAALGDPEGRGRHARGTGDRGGELPADPPVHGRQHDLAAPARTRAVRGRSARPRPPRRFPRSAISSGAS